MLQVQLLVLIGIANGAPILAENILKHRFGRPVDGDLLFIDGKPLLGRSKTIRGLCAALLMAGSGAWLMGFPLSTGLTIGLGAMCGDLLSSFVKRRLGIPSSGMALGLDQIPEVLLPLLLVRREMGLEASDLLAMTLLFFAFELVISRILFRLRIRKQPY